LKDTEEPMSLRNTVYSLSNYGDMIQDKGRIKPYMSALQKVIKPGCTVLDIGAGTGFFSLVACELGAGKVIAVEYNPAITLAREIIAANGLSDRITCISGLSTELDLDEPVDVIVSDLRGVLPLFQQHLPSIIDARKRLLASDGVLLSQRDSLWAAPVELPRAYQRIEKPWLDNDYGLNLSAVHRFEINNWTKQTVTVDHLLAPGKPWLELNYNTLDRCDGSGHLHWQISRGGMLHGLLAWFDTTIIEGIGFSNAPDQPPLIYGQAFFPLPAPVPVELGDQVEATIAAHWINQDYIWRWRGQVVNKDGVSKGQFDQSTFASAVPATENNSHNQENVVLKLTVEIEIEKFILSHVDGITSCRDLATLLCEAYPTQFKQSSALARVSETMIRIKA
jgi:protein arginine N-methyltransferase 1